MKSIFKLLSMFVLILLVVSCQKTEMNEIEDLMKQSAGKTYPVTESHIGHLPEPLQNYLRNVGVAGGNYYNNVKFTYKGNFKMSGNSLATIQ